MFSGSALVLLVEPMGEKEEKEVDVDNGKVLPPGLFTGETGMAISHWQPLLGCWALGGMEKDWLGQAGGPRNGRLDMPLIDEGIAPGRELRPILNLQKFLLSMKTFFSKYKTNPLRCGSA